MPKTKNGSGIARRVDIGSKLVPGDTTQAFKGQNATSGNPPGLAPLGHGALVDAQFTRHRALPASGLYRLLHKICPHEFMLITEIDRRGNTESDSARWHPAHMIKTRQETTFWERLMEAAKANGIEPSQSAIARELKVRQSAVAKWKAGGRPKTTRIEEIARQWRYNVNWLLNEEGPKRPAGVGEPDDTAELLALWKGLTPPARKALLEQVRVIRSLTPKRSPETA